MVVVVSKTKRVARARRETEREREIERGRGGGGVSVGATVWKGPRGRQNSTRPGARDSAGGAPSAGTTIFREDSPCCPAGRACPSSRSCRRLRGPCLPVHHPCSPCHSWPQVFSLFLLLTTPVAPKPPRLAFALPHPETSKIVSRNRGTQSLDWGGAERALERGERGGGPGP